LATSTRAGATGTLPGVELGIRVQLRDVLTLDDLEACSAEATVTGLHRRRRHHIAHRVEAVLLPPPGAPVTPVLGPRHADADRAQVAA
jgi:hypothetical protein